MTVQPVRYKIRLEWKVENGSPWPVVTPVELPGHADVKAVMLLLHQLSVAILEVTSAELLSPLPDNCDPQGPLEFTIEINEDGAPKTYSRKTANKLETAVLLYALQKDHLTITQMTIAQTVRLQGAASRAPLVTV